MKFVATIIAVVVFKKHDVIDYYHIISLITCVYHQTYMLQYIFMVTMLHIILIAMNKLC